MARDLIARQTEQHMRERAHQALSVVWADSGDEAEVLGPGADLAIVTDAPRLVARQGRFAPEVLEAMAGHLSGFLAGFATEAPPLCAALD